MHIWHVNNIEYTSLLLYRTDKNAFRVIQDGEYQPILANGTYTLVNQTFKEIFLLAKDQLNIQHVTIHDLQFNTVTEEYIELILLNAISPYSIETEDHQGCKIWGHGGHIFVSDQIKVELSKHAGNSLSFSPGFLQFAA